MSKKGELNYILIIIFLVIMLLLFIYFSGDGKIFL